MPNWQLSGLLGLAKRAEHDRQRQAEVRQGSERLGRGSAAMPRQKVLLEEVVAGSQEALGQRSLTRSRPALALGVLTRPQGALR